MIETQHKIPIHLDQPDKFILGMTGRQTIIIALGLALGYMAFIGFDYTHNLFLLVPALLCFVLCLLAAILLAFVRYKHKDLEQWALIVFMFYATPRRYIWQPVMVTVPNNQELALSDGLLPMDQEKGHEEVW